MRFMGWVPLQWHRDLPDFCHDGQYTIATRLTGEISMALRKFIIERDIPKVGTFEREQLRQASAKSNEVLRQLGPDIQ